METLTFVYDVPGLDGEDRSYLIRRGRVRAEMATPRTVPERARLDELVKEIFTPPDLEGTSIPSHEIDELLLLSSWFRRYPKELDRARPTQRRSRRRSA